MSLKSRIRDAQREAANRTKRDARRNASDKDDAPIFGAKDDMVDELNDAMPTVEEIRIALLSKSTNGKNTQ